jgi:hypothetical protein
LKPYIEKCVVVYTDDILIFDRIKEEDLKSIFVILRKEELYINWKRCTFFKELLYLGFVELKEGLQRVLDKVSDLRLAHIVELTEVRSFLSILNFYRKFTMNISDMCTSIMECMNMMPFLVDASIST